MRDIEIFIKSAVNKDSENRRWKVEDKQLVIDTLIKNADGMFRWVYCQLVYLRGCNPGRIRYALSELPETLDETYERTLRAITNTNWELAHGLFQFVAVASRPLRVEELAEFLALDFKSGPIARFQEGWRLADPLDAVLSTCSTLLALVSIDGSPVIQFSHFSVREFLTSTRLAEAAEPILSRYHISMTSAHTLVAQGCLGILLHLDKTITRDGLKNYPLAEYAGRHWFEHARFENVSQCVEDGMVELFDRKKPHLGIWVWIHDPGNPLIDSGRAEKPLPPRETPSQYATVCGLHGIAKFLSRGLDHKSAKLHVASADGHVDVARILVEQGADVMARDNDGKTSLHAASKKGHVEVTRFLVEHGADVTARDNNGWTPLHVASSCGSVEVACLLIKHGADVTARADDGRTPLVVAAEVGNVEVIRVLIDHRTDKTTTQPTQRGQFIYYVFVFCFFVGIYLQFM